MLSTSRAERILVGEGRTAEIFEWGDDGKPRIKASADLTAAELSCLTIKVRVDADGKHGVLEHLYGDR